MASLSINRSFTRSGTWGTDGAHGTDHQNTRPTTAGGDGADGQRGGGASLSYAARNFASSGVNDVVNLYLMAGGGRGGQGGAGGYGTSDEFNAAFTDPNRARYTQNWLAGGDGGDGGAGGIGGAASLLFSDLGFNGIEKVLLSAIAGGGAGGAGQLAATGGSGGFSATRVINYESDGSSLSETYTAAPGGDSGLPGHGGAGSLAQVSFRSLEILSGRDVDLVAEALGGTGGSGAHASSGGPGSSAGVTATGGAGGRGGDGRATINAVTVQDNLGAADNIFIDLEARGGAGGQGGQGALGGMVQTEQTVTTYSAGGIRTFSSTGVQDHAPSSAGGQGGAGGNALVTMTGNTINTGGGNDVLTVALEALGGGGGAGGAGGALVEDRVYTPNNTTFTVHGSASGATGAKGADGTAQINFSNNTVSLGAGDDLFLLSLNAQGRITSLTFQGNTLDGGAGNDTLWFDTPGRVWNAVVDVALGRISIGGSPFNTMTGFENFSGGRGNDRFVDGPGAHSYAGGGGQDAFVFTRTHGQDVVNFLEAGDRIEFQRFGARLDSFADVLARATDTGGSVVIDTVFGGSLTIQGWTKATLTADMFGFT